MVRTAAAYAYSCRCLLSLTLLIVLCCATNTHAQSTTYHLHQEASTTAGLFQLKTAATDAATVSVSSINLKNKNAGEYIVKAFDTQSGVPNASGVIPSGSTVSFSVWMRQTVSTGAMVPRAKVMLNSATGTLLCTATGTALTTTLTKHTFSCATSANVSMTTSDRLYVWVGTNVTTKATLDTFVTLNIEGTPDGNYDSTVQIPAPLPPPSVTSLSPNAGPVGVSITIAGSNFGSTQGGSSVTFNGTAATTSNWSPTSISAFVPTGATSGPVVVNVGGAASNSLAFTVTPQVSSLSPNTGLPGDVVTIGGSSFGATQGTSTVKFNGITATPTSWNATTIVTPVPAGTTTGNVVVTIGGQPSNAVVFTVGPPVPTETLTIYLHKEASSTSGSLQLKTTGQDAAVFALQTGDLKGLPTNADYLIKEFDTQANVPNTPGVIPIFTPITFTLWMKKTANFGEMYPKVKLTLNNGTPVCESDAATGPANAITTSLFDFIVTCHTTSELTLTATDRFNLWVGVYAFPPTTDSVRAELDIEQGRESNFSLSLPVPRPVISGISPNGASIGTSVTINGSNFGASQGTNSLTFNGIPTPTLSWSNTQIVAQVPVGATTGPVVVKVRNVPSDGFTYNVAAGTISGTVTRVLDGSPVPGTFVEAIQGGAPLGATRTSATGAYSIGGLASGTYELRASADLFAAETQTGIVVTEGSTTNVNVALYRSGSIGGRITQPDGTTGIAGAEVKVYQSNQIAGTAATDSNGNYSVSTVRPGLTNVQVFASGYQVKTQTGVSVTEQANTTLNLSLDPVSGANLVKYNYDEAGRLSTVENGAGQVAKYTYDATGNLLKITRHDSTQVSVLQFTPANGTAGTSVTIYGTGFSATPAQNTVTFNGVSAAIVSATTTQIVATAPAGVTTGLIAVTSPLGSAISDAPFTVPANGPTISSFSPNVADPGATVAISGTNFETVTTKNVVAIGSGRALVTGATTSTVNVTVPARGGSGKIRLNTPAGVAQSTQDFFYPPTPWYMGCCTASQIEYVGRMAFGDSHVFNITVPGKKALVVFDATAGQLMGLTINNALTATPRSLDYSIFNPDGSIFKDGNINGPGSAFVTSKKTTNLFGGYSSGLPATGTYTVLIDPVNDSIGTVTLTLGESSPDVTYGIDPGGPTKTVTTISSSQNALVQFKGYAGQRVSLRLANATVSGFLRVMGADWTELTQISISTNNNDSNTRFRDTFVLPSAGTYTLLVSLTGSQSTTRSVDLTLYNVPPDITNPILPGSPVTATTTVPGQNALFTFAGTPGQRVSFSLAPTTASGRWEVIEPDGSEMSYSPSINVTSGGFIDPITIPTTGNYSLMFDGNHIAGAVTATMYNVPADFSGSITINGAAANINTSPGQNADVTFTGTAGQLVTVRVTDNSMGSVTVRLFDTNNAQLTSTTSSAANFNLTQKTLSVNGTYRINVNPSGANAGIINVSVTSP